MRAVIAGGAGFIGSHLCEHLLARGLHVVCVDNLITGRKQNIQHLFAGAGFRFVRADVTEPLRIPGRIDLVYNLASPASPKDYLALPLETLAVGAVGTTNLLDLALKKKAVFVQASTSEVYGDPSQHPQKETYWGNVNPIGPRSVYDESKRYAEALASAYHRKHGLRTKIARIFNTYGPRMKHDDGRVVPGFIDDALNGRPLTVYGNGKQTRSFCFVSDMVEALFRMATCPDHLPVNLGNPREFTILHLAGLVRRLTSAGNPIRFAPLPEDDPVRRRPDIAKARRLLGWQPLVPLAEGLRLTIDWFRSAGAAKS